MRRLPRPTGRILVPCLVSVALLSGCSMPQSAGLESQVIAGAEEPDADFALYPVTRANLDQLKSWPLRNPQPGEGWIKGGGGPASSVIEAGDELTVTIWDNEESSLLKPPGEKAVPLPRLQVAADGTVFLPYADKVYVAKMTPEQAREAIQTQLLPLIPSVQVQVTHVSGRKNAVDLVSGVPRPGTVPLPDRNFSILSLLAQGGGVSEAMVNPQVRLQRDGKLYSISLDRLLDEPAMDTVLRGGDKVYVESDERYFLSLGAAGKRAPISFPQERVTALDAMALMGGLDGARADAKAILVLRSYSERALRSDGTGPDKDRVIFSFDLTTADGLFSAGEFPIGHQDLVLVTESPLLNTRSIFSLFSQAVNIGQDVGL